ncbi:hypothetical protein BH20BAC1_BH20BAC1_10510 [soil metagenome]
MVVQKPVKEVTQKGLKNIVTEANKLKAAGKSEIVFIFSYPFQKVRLLYPRQYHRLWLPGYNLKFYP